MALAGKAARGAGAPAQQAVRFGQAAAVHLMAGRSPDALTVALDLLPEGPILAYPLALDQAICTAKSNGSARITSVPQDALMDSYIQTVPFLARAESTEDNGWTLIVDFTTPRPRQATGRITGCDRLVARMTELAARTFVPESENSRLAGAGAGLTDND